MSLTKPTLTTLLVLLNLFTYSQSIIYSENFNGQNGKGATGGSPSISIDTATVSWSVDTSNVLLTASDDYMKVVNDTFEFRDLDGPGKWSSPSIDISSFSNLTLGLYLSEEGSQSSLDSMSVYYSIDGGNEIHVCKVNDDFTSKTLTDTSISGIGNLLKIHIYARNTAGTKYHRVDNIVLKGNDKTSDIDEPATQVSSSTISSLLDTDAEAVDVFKFKIVDDGTLDGLASKVTNIRLKPGPNNTADWTDNIQGIKLFNGAQVTIGSVSISDTEIDIPITSGNLTISDNSNSELTVQAYLNTSNIEDGKIIQFMIDADNHGLTNDNSGSTIKDTINGGVNINSNNFTLGVIATKLLFVQQPSEATINQYMNPDVTIEATDVNGSRDIDYSTSVSLTSSGTMSSTPLSKTPALGLATFDSIEHSATGTGLQLTAGSGAFSNATSSSFNIIEQAGLSIDTVDKIFTIDFDNTVSGINEGTFNGSGIVASQSSGKLNSNGISITGFSDGDVSFGGSNSSGDYARGTSSGGVTTGGLYSFLVSTGNYALGIQSSGGDFTPGSITFKIQNNTGKTVTGMLIGSHIWELNDQDISTSVEFSYSTDEVNFTTNSDLTILSDTLNDTSSMWRKSLVHINLSSLTLTDGSYIYIKMTMDDATGSGSRDELAIGDLSFIAYSSIKNLTSISGIEGEYNTLVINGSGIEAGASGDVTVLNQLKLKNGLFNLNSHKLTLGNNSSDCEVSDASSSSYIFGGDIRYYTNNSVGSYKFEYGSSNTEYSRAQIDFNSSTLAPTAYLEASVTASKHPNFDNGVTSYVERYWTINSTGITSPDYNITLAYVQDDVTGVENDLLPVKYASGTWTAPGNVGNGNIDTVGAGAVNADSNFLTWTNVDGFSIFGGAANGTPLPIELIYFNGIATTNGNLLSWATASEIDNDYFEIEKLETNNEFTPISKILSKGFSNKKIEYQFVDQKTKSGSQAYRLKQVDFNGNSTYSNIIYLDNKNETNHEIESISMNKNLIIYNIPKDSKNISILNISGTTVFSSYLLGKESFSVDLSYLPNGIYIFKIENVNKELITSKFLLSE